MDQKKDKKALFDAESYVAIFTGTAVRTIAALAQGLSLKTGQNSELLCRHLFFDFMQHLPQSLSAELGLDIDQIFGPESFVSSAIPTDPESLAKADEAGLLGPMSQGWYLNPAIGGDNKGAAGNPCLGYVQALFNKRALKRRLHRLIQEAIDHARGNTLVLEGMEENSVLARLVIHLYFSTVGGTGPGSMPWFISEDGIRSCAQQDGVQSNIVLHVIGRGNLPTHDTSLADLNELTTLKYLQAYSTGTYVVPNTGKMPPAAYDVLFFSTNQNCHGNILDLDQFLYHQAYCEYFLYHTPGGAKMRERLVDILSNSSDEYGDLRNVHTASCALIGCDSKRNCDYCNYRGAAILAGSLLAPGDNDKVAQQAAGLARSCQITESEELSHCNKINDTMPF